MIDLTNARVLRTSQNHNIFDHPEDERALLKVRCESAKNGTRFLRRYSEWRYGNLRQWNREANEYLAALHRGVPELARLARFMGYAQTSVGPALVVEKMTNSLGELAPTVRQELRSFPTGDPRRQAILTELNELLDDLERGGIVVGDFTLDNVVRASERGGRLVVIDGLGERSLVPLTIISNIAFRASIRKRRNRL